MQLLFCSVLSKCHGTQPPKTCVNLFPFSCCCCRLVSISRLLQTKTPICPVFTHKCCAISSQQPYFQLLSLRLIYLIQIFMDPQYQTIIKRMLFSIFLISSLQGHAVPSHSKIRDNKQELRGCHWWDWIHLITEKEAKSIFRRWPQGAHAGGCFLQLGRGQDGGGKVGLPPRCGGGTPGEELHIGGARQG